MSPLCLHTSPQDAAVCSYTLGGQFSVGSEILAFNMGPPH